MAVIGPDPLAPAAAIVVNELVGSNEGAGGFSGNGWG